MKAYIPLILLLFLSLCCLIPRSASADDFEQIEKIRPQIYAVLDAEGAPRWLIWLAWAESRGNTAARSHKGAVGLWQLTAPTARAYGLEVSQEIDERLNIEQSTRAAARYMKHLLKMFDGNLKWSVAAYNSGGRNLKRRTGYKKGMDFAIVKSVARESWGLAVTVNRLYKDKGI